MATGLRSCSTLGYKGVRTKYNECRTIVNNKNKAVKFLTEQFGIFCQSSDMQEAEDALSILIAKSLLSVAGSETQLVLLKLDDWNDDNKAEELIKLSELIHKGEKKLTYSQRDHNLVERVNFKDFMQNAHKLNYWKVKEKDKRNRVKLVNKGFMLHESSRVKIDLK